LPSVAVVKNTIRINPREQMRNDTSFDEEYITRRLMLLPLRLEPGEEKGLLFRISNPTKPAEPWRNTVGGSVYLRCKDVLVEKDGNQIQPESVFVYPELPILRLGLGEGLLCEFQAGLGSKSKNPTGELCTAFQVYSSFEFRPCVLSDETSLPGDPTKPFILGGDREIQEIVRDEKGQPKRLLLRTELCCDRSDNHAIQSFEKVLRITLDDFVRLREAWRRADTSVFLIEVDTPTRLRLVLAGEDGNAVCNVWQHAVNEVIDDQGLSFQDHFVGIGVIHMLTNQFRIDVSVPENSPTSARKLFEQGLDKAIQRYEAIFSAWKERNTASLPKESQSKKSAPKLKTEAPEPVREEPKKKTATKKAQIPTTSDAPEPVQEEPKKKATTKKAQIPTTSEDPTTSSSALTQVPKKKTGTSKKATTSSPPLDGDEEPKKPVNSTTTKSRTKVSSKKEDGSE
jgi:hypothetical protein